jgi:hypothetical protein
MHRRVAVPALFAAAAAGVAYALSRLRRGGAPSSGAPGRRRRGRGLEPPPQEYRCDCGQTFHVSGAGRHRVYWLPGASPSDPVLSPTCPECDRPLPRDPQAAGAPAS